MMKAMFKPSNGLKQRNPSLFDSWYLSSQLKIWPAARSDTGYVEIKHVTDTLSSVHVNTPTFAAGFINYRHNHRKWETTIHENNFEQNSTKIHHLGKNSSLILADKKLTFADFIQANMSLFTSLNP